MKFITIYSDLALDWEKACLCKLLKLPVLLEVSLVISKSVCAVTDRRFI